MAEPPAVGGGGWCGWLRGSGSGRSMRFALIGGLVAVLLAGWRVQVLPSSTSRLAAIDLATKSITRFLARLAALGARAGLDGERR